MQVATGSTSPVIRTVLHARPYGRFIEIKSNFKGKKLHITNYGSIFLEAVLEIETMKVCETIINEKHNHSILQDDFFHKQTHPFSQQ